MSELPEHQQRTATQPTYSQYRSLVPPLTEGLHKGQGGRIGILGGSSDYTGAPYFSGMGALRLGADLCHIICDEDAATAIKSFSPDLIVHPYIKVRAANAAQDEKSSAIWAQTFDDISAILKRVHVLVVGPGLSRDKGMFRGARHAIEKAKELELPIVLDADALVLIQNEPELIHGYTKAVLTPNVVEFGRLCDAMNIDAKSQKSEEPSVQKLAQALGGVTVVEKGKVDVISDGSKVHIVSNEGGLKRSGGQGDILSGMLGASLAWGQAYEKDVWNHSHPVATEDVVMTACFGACVINRECSRLAYDKHKRAVQSSDVLQVIGPFFFNFYDKSKPTDTWASAISG
ncbi:hypothetical protein BGZ50_003022 [Haplosporangium sp. Z 11]|nr:hypothetical protein BGZ50_003022 [Haplosporangium sp. Z 11]